MSDLLTLNEIRSITGAAKHRLQYVVDAFNVEPAGWLGPVRFWLRSDLPRFVDGLHRTAASGRGRRRTDPRQPEARP